MQQLTLFLLGQKLMKKQTNKNKHIKPKQTNKNKHIKPKQANKNKHIKPKQANKNSNNVNVASLALNHL